MILLYKAYERVNVVKTRWKWSYLAIGDICGYVYVLVRFVWLTRSVVVYTQQSKM